MGTIWIEGQFKSLARPVMIISELVETKKACILLEDNKKESSKESQNKSCQNEDYQKNNTWIK